MTHLHKSLAWCVAGTFALSCSVSIYATTSSGNHTSPALKSADAKNKAHSQQNAWQKPSITPGAQTGNTHAARKTDPKAFPGGMWKPKVNNNTTTKPAPKVRTYNTRPQTHRHPNNPSNPKQFPGGMWKPKR